MSLIERLKERVNPMVLAQESEHIVEKSTALAAFYPFLLSILKAKPSLIAALQNNLNPRVEDLFGTHGHLKHDFLQAISQTAPPHEIERTLNHSIAPTLHILEDEAGSQDPMVIEHYLNQHQSDIKGAVAPWAMAFLTGLGVSSTTAATPVPPPVEEKSKNGWWLPLIALLILLGLMLFLFKMCSHPKEDTRPVANTTHTVATPVSLQPAYFQLSTNSLGNLTSCVAHVGQPSFIAFIQAEVKRVFSGASDCSADGGTHYAADLADQGVFSQVLALVKGSPNTVLTWTNQHITLQGDDQVKLNALAEKIKALAPQLTILVQPAFNADTSVTNSIEQSKTALSQINPNQVDAAAIATALNLQIINFATDSAEIPAVNKAVLDQAATLIQKVPEVSLTIQGFTDAVGHADYNKQLSQKRAQSVLDYLVAKGVSQAQLHAEGFGQDQPVADNQTPEGQFKNRRIAFEVLNTATGTTREVGQEGVKIKN